MAEVVIIDSEDEAGNLVASAIRTLIDVKPDAVLGLATGSTPMPIYQALARTLSRSPLDVSQVRGFALDEYVGLAEGHPESYREVITRDVVIPLGLVPKNIQVPRGLEASLSTAGADYERAIVAAGGVDLQILGIGSTGHLGFNEPGSSLGSLTRVKTLAAQTRADNARFFDSPEQVPRQCITQGLGTIMRARHLVLLARGEGKAAVIAAALEGPITASQPASVLQLHPHVTVILDEAAAGLLGNLDYYRSAWENKLDWESI
jgi:glucosamine-6-phosphate deaminase